MFRRLMLAGAIAWGAIASGMAAAPTAQAAPNAPTVRVSDGPVQGFYAQGVAEFLGIPYAAPPVGDLRWRPPAPPEKWTDTRLAIHFGNTCVQNQPGHFAHPSITEDCLYLNVFAPKDYAKTGPHPVLFWIYGGGLTAGESNDYDGSKLAKAGAVVVTINFRVGTLGFFAHPALDAEGHDKGDYGLMDIQQALRWVQANIGKFGGDPKRVTIFGQSGGATAVMANLVSPTAKGLFHSIINESGTHVIVTPLADAEKAGESFAAKAHCTQGAAADVAACLRKLSPAQIVATALPPASYYIQDGTIITQPTYRSFETGQFNQVPIMTGLTADEQAFFLPELQGGPRRPLSATQFNAFVASFGKDHVQDILKAYPLSAYDSPSLADIAVAQGNKACTARNFDQLWSKYVPVYAYQFDDETTPSYLPPASYPTRAFHTSELLYLFPLFRGGQGQAHELTPAQEKLADRMVKYWVNFAGTGNPNGKNAKGEWSRYATADDNVLVIGEDKSTMTKGYGAQTYPHNMKNDCALWDHINTYVY
ncbi:MAG TPA: carboxylesterase family protein [Stellaceae bacterium]|nr:carboxylesterase family protein [Stellaceae bacterium]